MEILTPRVSWLSSPMLRVAVASSGSRRLLRQGAMLLLSVLKASVNSGVRSRVSKAYTRTAPTIIVPGCVIVVAITIVICSCEGTKFRWG